MPSIVSALMQAQKPAQRSWLSTTAWLAEAGLMRLLAHPPPREAPRLLNLGCGDVQPEGWLNADFATPRWWLQRRRWPQWNLDASRRWRCPDDWFEGIHCEHMLEHVPYDVAIHVVRECRRVLRPGGVLRVSVPDVRKFVDFYNRLPSHSRFDKYQLGAVAISRLTQCDAHLSVWDAPTLIGLLREVGFREVVEQRYGVSRLARVIDVPDRAWESCYVEAVK